jgi:hypothetical protein
MALRKLANYFTGWLKTWRIKRESPETYRFLTDYLASGPHDPDDFADAPRPEDFKAHGGFTASNVPEYVDDFLDDPGTGVRRERPERRLES